MPVPEIISNTLPYALGCITVPSFIFNGKLNDIWLTVISMFSLPVYVDGEIVVSYIAKNTCDNSVIMPMYELAFYTPCNVYSLLVLFKINYKP